MQLIIDLPDRATVLAKNRQHWAEVLRDERWQQCEERVETTAAGQIIMTPPPTGLHSSRCGRLIVELSRRLNGRVLPECPVSTADGVRVADVGWFSDSRYEHVRAQAAFELAPEVCVEVLSPRNTELEMQTKRSLYFDAGAIECWLCDLDGRMHYFKNADAHTSHNQSELCPNFPNQIED